MKLIFRRYGAARIESSDCMPIFFIKICIAHRSGRLHILRSQGIGGKLYRRNKRNSKLASWKFGLVFSLIWPSDICPNGIFFYVFLLPPRGKNSRCYYSYSRAITNSRKCWFFGVFVARLILNETPGYHSKGTAVNCVLGLFISKWKNWRFPMGRGSLRIFATTIRVVDTWWMDETWQSRYMLYILYVAIRGYWLLWPWISWSLWHSKI